MRLTPRQVYHLAVIGLSAAILGYLAWEGWRAWKNHRVRQWVHSYGGIVDYWRPDQYGHQIPFRTPWFIHEWAGEPVFDGITSILVEGSPQISVDEVEMLTQLGSLKGVCIGVTSFSDDHTAKLINCRSVTDLMLENTEVTDDGLRLIAESMPQLTFLRLKGNSAITPDGLRHLSQLPNLGELDLKGMILSNDDLPTLHSIPALTNLHVGAAISNGGIRHLVQMDSLTELHFYHSEITDSDLDLLTGALPKLEGVGLTSCYNVSREKWVELEKAGLLLAY